MAQSSAASGYGACTNKKNRQNCIYFGDGEKRIDVTFNASCVAERVISLSTMKKSGAAASVLVGEWMGR